MNSCKSRQGQCYDCRNYVESSCVDRQEQGFDCKNYVVSYQNKRFNFTRLASKNWKTTNLEILKFEARASHSSGQILAGFLRLSFLNFLQMTRLVKAFYSKEICG